jgi:hypothetical protein
VALAACDTERGQADSKGKVRGILTSKCLNARLASLPLDVRRLDHLAPSINLVVHISGRLFGRAAKYLR